MCGVWDIWLKEERVVEKSRVLFHFHLHLGWGVACIHKYNLKKDGKKIN
jgi:hypothetical protein